MDDTQATVTIAAVDQAAAQTDLGVGFFNTPASASGSAPATHYFTQGAYKNSELEFIANDAKWKGALKLGTDWEGALASLDLKMIVEQAAP